MSPLDNDGDDEAPPPSPSVLPASWLKALLILAGVSCVALFAFVLSGPSANDDEAALLAAEREQAAKKEKKERARAESEAISARQKEMEAQSNAVLEAAAAAAEKQRAIDEKRARRAAREEERQQAQAEAPALAQTERAPENERQAKRARYAGNVEIYTTSWCPACRKLRAYLASRQVSYTDHDIENEPGALEAKREVQKRHALACTSVPLVVIGDFLSCGYSTEELDEKLGLR